jgi:hypothetical protein
MMFDMKLQKMVGLLINSIKILPVTNKMFKATANVDLFPDLKLT